MRVTSVIGRLCRLAVVAAAVFVVGGDLATAADYYWDTNGATPFGDGVTRWRQSSNVAIWSTSPLGDVDTIGVGGSAAIGSVQFGFGPAPENPGAGGQIEVSNNNAGSQDPNVSGMIFNASGAAPYAFVNRAANPAATITVGVGGLDMPEGVGILVNDNVVGDTTFRVNPASASPETNDFRIAISADQIWRNTSPTYALDVGIKVTGDYALTTEGPGLIVLGRRNDFTGGLTIASGTLRAADADALSSGAVTVAAGGTLDVRAAIVHDIAGDGLVTIAPGASLTAGSMGSTTLLLAGEAGNAASFTSTAAGDLGLASVTMGGNATIGLAAGTTIAAAGGVSFAGTDNFLSLSGVASPGSTYSLLTGTSLDTSGSIVLTGAAVGGQVISLGSSATVGRTTYAFSNTGTALQLGVTGTQLTLTWTGADTNFWNYNELISNWSDNGTPTFFGVGDNAVIDAATTISVRPAGVAAGDVSVTNASGTVLIDGGELAATTLTKTNAGVLELGGAVNIGTLTVSAGTLSLVDGVSVTAANLVNNATLSHAGGVDKTLTTSLSGTGILTQSGTGRLTLGGAGDYSGSMSVAAGSVLELGETALLGPAGVYSGGIDVSGELVAASSTGQDLAGPLTGAGTLTKSGAGVVTISGNNAGFGGLINVTAGTLRLGSSGALGGATPAVLVGGALDLGGQAITGKDIVVQGTGVEETGGFVNSDLTTAASWSGQVILGSASTGLGGDGDMTITGVVSGGGLTKYGEGTVTLANTNTYTGTLSIQQGTVRALNQAALPNGDLGWSSSGSSAALDLVAAGDYPISTISTFGSNLRVITTGSGQVSLTIAGQSSLGGNADKTLQVGENVTAVLQGDVVAGSANRERSLRFLNAGDVVLNGTISSSSSFPFGLVQTSNAGEAVPENGTLHVNGTNVYTGTTRVSAGTLKVGNILALGTTDGGTLLNVATENIGTDAEPIIQAIPGVNPGTLDLNGYAISGEALTLEGTYGRPQMINSSLTTPVSWSGGIDVIDAGGIGGPGAIELTGVITGAAGQLAKVGPGTVTLSAVSNFLGTIAVEQGTLVVGAGGSVADAAVLTTSAGARLDLVAVGAYTVPAAQTLGGSGTIAGSFVIGGGAGLAPGASPGALTLTDGVTWNGGGNYDWQMASATGTAGDAAAWDLVTIGGPLTIGSTSTEPFAINLWTLSGTNPDTSGPAANFDATQNYTWKIATAAGGITGFAADKFTVVTAPTARSGGFANDFGTGTFSVAQSGNDLNLVFTAGSGPVPITIDVASGSQTQAQAGYPTIAAATSVTKTGAGTLVFDAANAYTGPTTISAGTLEVAAAGAVAGSDVTVDTGATLQVASGTTMRSPSVIVDGGTLSAGAVAVNSSTGITSLAINAGTISGSPTVTVGSGGQLSLVQDARVTVGVGGLSVDEAGSGGRVDLGAGMISIASGGISAADLRADIIAGRNGGAWTGATGITSSTAAASGGTRAVGYVVAADGSAQVSYAAAGDVDLSGAVNVFDLVSINSAGKYGTGGSSVWSQGDFNYDGATNVFDLVGVNTAGAYGQGNYFPAAPSATGGVAAVPEPTTGLLAAAGLAALGLAARRRATTAGR
jgi:fibronectin-binding autotransporter adhesin